MLLVLRLQYIDVSIHAPVKVRRVEDVENASAWDVSIHAPVKVRPLLCYSRL